MNWAYGNLENVLKIFGKWNLKEERRYDCCTGIFFLVGNNFGLEMGGESRVWDYVWVS